ncbi:hypothetical protein GCM10010398_63360 [Streptomyces fimbriatus]
MRGGLERGVERLWGDGGGNGCLAVLDGLPRSGTSNTQREGSRSSDRTHTDMPTIHYRGPSGKTVRTLPPVR